MIYNTTRVTKIWTKNQFQCRTKMEKEKQIIMIINVAPLTQI